MDCTQEMVLWLDIIAKLAPAVVALVVGIFGTYIGFNQYRTNRDKLRLDLFDKRLEAYEKLQEYFNCLLRDAQVDNKAISILAEVRYKSLFLFGDEITEHINEVWDKAIEMRRLNLNLYGSGGLPVGEERNIICDEESRLLQWNLNQQNDSPKRYAKYLKFM
ncbi:MAG: hypothetical protein NW220_20250 [Leptolyngbyaceae cyanobacterium bins.349]|nr:hypothetical protein [Leptolyngbyaceae cyanobacterium bins.349]